MNKITYMNICIATSLFFYLLAGILTFMDYQIASSVLLILGIVLMAAAFVLRIKHRDAALDKLSGLDKVKK